MNESRNENTATLINILKKIPLFSTLDENLHREIINHIILMYYPVNYVLFREGDEGDAMYIIKKGKVQIYHEPKEEGDPSRKVAHLMDNDFFGEMALISEIPRNASAKVTEESEIFILSKSDFKKLLNTNTVLAEQISKTVVERLKDNDLKK